MAKSDLTQKLLAEFTGTYFLVLTIGYNILSGQGVWAVLSIASVLMVFIYSLASVSGANFNPAVSLTLYLAKIDTDFKETLAYMGTQIAAGLCAGLTYTMAFGASVPGLSPGEHAEHGKFNALSAGAIEIFYTFLLCFVVLRAACKAEADNETFGLAIGFVIVAGGYAGGWISGGCFNPAVAFGIDVTSVMNGGIFWCLIYTLYEFIGAGLAVGAYMFLESSSSDMAKKCFSEALGTFVLVATVGLNVLSGSGCALSIAASLMVMIYALAAVSGANFNPAVTTALALTGKIELKWVLPYVLSQISGGLLGAFFYYAVVGHAFKLEPQSKKNGEKYSWGAVGFAEIFYTFLLCYVVLIVAAVKDKVEGGNLHVHKKIHFKDGGQAYQMYGLAIGFCIVVGGNAIGAVSGGSLNPAVSIALDATGAVHHSGYILTNSIFYSCFELLGAGLAAGLFYLLRDEQFSKDAKRRPLKMEDPETSYGTI
jgi:aquaporin Z